MINIDINEIDTIGLAYGELALKGKNRGDFEKNIRTHIQNRIRNLDFKVVLVNDMSKLYLSFEKGKATDVINSIKNVFGINNISYCVKTESEILAIKKEILKQAKFLYEKGARNFKVSVNRADKNFLLNSMELAKELGAEILINSEFTSVKMKDPDVLINVDIRKNTYIYTEKKKSYGGLPIASTGYGLSLISGGIDSPVASFMMSKRGMKLSYVTFHSFPFTSQKSLDKIEDLVKILTKYNGKSKFFTVNILKAQQLIKQYTNKDYATILTRRLMMRISEKIAEIFSYKALITGESLGQVASQTIGGLSCTNASVKLPVFRPLIGMDKVEIMEKAQEIGTFKKSIEPFEDSCSMFAPKHPITQPKLENVIEEEAKIPNYDNLIEEIIKEVKLITVKEETL